jgi:hypothetical protein
MPQVPLLQAPEQHCAAEAQGLPSEVQPVAATHCEELQDPEQHAASLAQASPSPAQPPAPHTLPVQAWLQQSAAALQGAPSDAHVGAVLAVVVVVLVVVVVVPPVPPAALVVPVELLVVAAPPPPALLVEPDGEVVTGKPVDCPQAARSAGTARRSAARADERCGMGAFRVS